MKFSDLHKIVLLSDYVVLDAIGSDAFSFLQGQLTCDLEDLAANALVGGYCGANGRLLATVWVWQHPVEPLHFRLLVHRSLGEALRKRLSMFVLRSDVTFKLSDAGVYGGYHDGPSSAPHQSYSVTQDGNTTLIQAPSGEQNAQRCWVISAEPIDEASTSLDDAQIWDAETLLEGVPHLQLATQDLFIPQTLNLELIGGVSFSKGCFPGQEVVARSHYRGTIRRRSALFTVALNDTEAAELLTMGADLFSATDSEAATGRVINYAKHGEHYVVLAEVMLADIEEMEYRLGSSQGPRLTKQGLSYDIFEQRENVRPKL